MKRKRFTAALLCMNMILASVGTACAAETGDVIQPEAQGERHAAYINGFEDGTIRPSNKLTRAEAMQIMHNIDEANPLPDEKFSESKPVSRGVFADMILSAETCPAEEMSDFLTGYPDGTLGLDRTLTRAEAVTMLNRAYGRSADRFSVVMNVDIRVMPDVPDTHWAYYEFIEAVTEHTAFMDENMPDVENWTSHEPGRVDLPAGWRHYDGNLFYVSEGGLFLYNTAVDGLQLDQNGRFTTGNSELDSLLRAEVKKIVNSNMTQQEKLRAVYDYMIKNYSYRGAETIEAGATGWEQDMAAAMLKSGKGNCYSWAAAFTYLARQVGYDAKAISGTAVSPKGSERGHGWTEIKIGGVVYTFDPEIEGVYGKTAGESYDLFMKPYGEAVWTYNKPDSYDKNEQPGSAEADRELCAMLDRIYGDYINEVGATFDAAVTPENEKGYLGVEGLEYVRGAAREAMIMINPHSVVLLEMKDGSDVAAAAKAIKENVDGYKWICVGVAPENIVVETSGNYILLVMDNDYSKQIAEGIKNI